MRRSDVLNTLARKLMEHDKTLTIGKAKSFVDLLISEMEYAALVVPPRRFNPKYDFNDPVVPRYVNEWEEE